MVEMVMLDEVIDTSIDEQLLLDYDNDGEIHLFAVIGDSLHKATLFGRHFTRETLEETSPDKLQLFQRLSIHNFTYHE